MSDYKIYRSGNLRADKIKYTDGVGICIWFPLSENDDECGLCFDISEEDVDSLISLLEEVREAAPDEYKED